MTRSSNHTVGCIEHEVGGKCGTHDIRNKHKILPEIPAPKAPLGGNMLRWDDNIYMDLKGMRI
jgi:hypothetical protein